jgi:hypothetical protein
MACTLIQNIYKKHISNYLIDDEFIFVESLIIKEILQLSKSYKIYIDENRIDHKFFYNRYKKFMIEFRIFDNYISIFLNFHKYKKIVSKYHNSGKDFKYYKNFDYYKNHKLFNHEWLININNIQYKLMKFDSSIMPLFEMKFKLEIGTKNI